MGNFWKAILDTIDTNNTSNAEHRDREDTLRYKVLYWGAVILSWMLLLSAGLFRGELLGEGVDLYGTVWFYGWVHYAFSTGIDPSWTSWFFYPFGKDIFAHTGSNIIDAILAMPFQMILGQGYGLAWFVFLMMLLHVWSLRYLLLSYTKDRHIVWIATMLWVWNPYILSELSMGRVTQTLVFPSFWAIGYMRKLFEKPTVSTALPLGLLVALQGAIYWFYGYFLLAILLVLALQYHVEEWASLPEEAKEKRYATIFSRIRERLQYSVLAVCVCLLVISPVILKMVAKIESQEVPGLDVSNTVSWMQAYRVEEPYGVPFFQGVWGVLCGVLFLVDSRRWWWGVSVFFLFLGAMGNNIAIGGYTIPNVLYEFLVEYLPFWKRLWFPYRLVGYIHIVLLVWAVSVSTKYATKHSKIVGGLLLLGSVFHSWYYAMLPISSTQWTHNTVYDLVDAPLIELPIGYTHPTIMEQSIHHQPLFGGMGENLAAFRPKGYLRQEQNPYIQSLQHTLFSDSHSSYSLLDKQRIMEAGFQYVVLDRKLWEMELAKQQREDSPTITDEEIDAILFARQISLYETLGVPLKVDAELILWKLDASLVYAWSQAPDSLFPEEFRHTWTRYSKGKLEDRLGELSRIPER